MPASRTSAMPTSSTTVAAGGGRPCSPRGGCRSTGAARRRAAGPRDVARPGRLRGRLAGVRAGDRSAGRGGRRAVGRGAGDRREDAGRRLRRAGAASGTAVRCAPRPAHARARLGERPGHLRLHAVSGSLHERVPHAFAGFRLEQPVATLATVVEAPDAPSPGLLAGLALRLSERRYVTLGVRAGTAGRVVELVLHVDGEDRVLGVADVPAGRSASRSRSTASRRSPGSEYGERRRSSAPPTSRRSARVRAAGSSGSSAGCSSSASRLVTDAAPRPAAWADFDLLSLVHAPAR